jgi:hypothetical protein
MARVTFPTFPSGSCQDPSTWQFVGGVWKPKAVTLSGACVTALRFTTAPRGEILVKPDSAEVANSQEFRDLANDPAKPTEVPDQVNGLMHEEVIDLFTNFRNVLNVKQEVDPTTGKPKVDITVPTVPREQRVVVDTRPVPGLPPLDPDIERLIALGEQP